MLTVDWPATASKTAFCTPKLTSVPASLHNDPKSVGPTVTASSLLAPTPSPRNSAPHPRARATPPVWSGGCLLARQRGQHALSPGFSLVQRGAEPVDPRVSAGRPWRWTAPRTAPQESGDEVERLDRLSVGEAGPRRAEHPGMAVAEQSLFQEDKDVVILRSDAGCCSLRDFVSQS
ncbi:hypothetical protein BBO_08855 [Beauveria brongniartii RCEF 3172]|uniref:Uncharacterized protein n=1 Tax=Beauveria brongniartii RCEF 3172 TaxID=1081107 RepID=A0A166WZ88_9HYPO|nr:hypothetical protein BBO_08855 [Beauveria brongniartii RCEF 3172]